MLWPYGRRPLYTHSSCPSLLTLSFSLRMFPAFWNSKASHSQLLLHPRLMRCHWDHKTRAPGWKTPGLRCRAPSHIATHTCCYLVQWLCPCVTQSPHIYQGIILSPILPNRNGKSFKILIPVQGTYLDCGLDPWPGHEQKATDRCSQITVSLSLSLSLSTL